MPPSFRPRPVPTILGGLLAALALILGLVTYPSQAAAETSSASQTQTRTVTLTPTKISYVKKSSPKKSFAKKSTMYASKASYATYVSYAPVKLAKGETISSATLQVYVSGLTGKKKAKVSVTPVKDNWTASKLTYKKRPATAGGALNTATTVKASKTTKITLNAAKAASLIKSGASFRLTNTLANSSIKMPKGKKAPKLVVKITSSGTSAAAGPTVAPVPTPTPAKTTAAPSAPSPATSGKLVFAHYFPPYPISIDNADPTSDYYQRHYLQPSGENGKFANIGGLLRDRPRPRKPLSGDWKLTDLRTEIRQAINAGIDGFAVDILNLTGTNWERTQMLLAAAAQEAPSFKIMLQPDMTTTPGSATASELAAAMAKLAAHPSVYKLKDGTVVISPFKAEKKSPSHWAEVLRIMSSTHKVKATLLPLFLDANKMADYASVSYGFGSWGVRDAKLTASGPNYAAKAHDLGKIWMQPIGVQDVRPNQKLYEESGNTETLRATWARAINDDADLALLVTWNDYSEGTSFAPSAGHGTSFADINAYYAAKFRTGSYPSITSDVAYITHRVHRVATLPTGYSDVMVHWPGTGRTAPRDTVEVLTFLKAEATVQVTVGTKEYSYTAPKGVSAKLFDLADGYSSATVKRSGATVATVKTKKPVVRTVIQQDLAYYAVSSDD